MTTQDDYLFTAYCKPTNVAFNYSVNSSNSGTVDEIDVSVYCGGVLCDSNFNTIQDEFTFEIIKAVPNPKNATRYSQGGSLSNYGGSWILISPNMMYGGFSITFQIKSGGRWDAHTENINF